MRFEEQLHELIAERAMELSLQRQNNSGDPSEDWVQAEQEIRSELTHRSNELSLKLDLPDNGRSNRYLY